MHSCSQSVNQSVPLPILANLSVGLNGRRNEGARVGTRDSTIVLEVVLVVLDYYR